MPDPDELLASLERTGEYPRMRLGLDHVKRLLDHLDRPHAAFPAVLVAGTNGKGSTAAHLAAILSTAGLTTGLYTSPHLETVEERIRVDGLMIDRQRLTNLLQRVIETAAAAGCEPPTYFEAMTVAAMLHFVDIGVDVAVLEVGLGGRLDATNVVDPVLSVITEIALDHQQQLGDDLADIAREKAGILRPGVACCYWISAPEAREAVEAIADDLGVPKIDARQASKADNRTEWRRGREVAQTNQYLARAAAETLAARSELDLQLADSVVERALRSCRWPGRLEWVERPDGGQVLLDGAHNPHGIEALLPVLRERDVGVVFGALEDKQPEEMLDRLTTEASWTILTAPASERAVNPERLAEGRSGDVGVRTEPADALDAALERVAVDELLLVCGSLYLVGEVRGLLRKRWGRPERMDRIYGDGRLRTLG